MPALRGFIFFGIVGTVGFVIDASVLYMLKNVIGIYPAKVISFICAVITTWFLNRHLTFRKNSSALPIKKEIIRYFSVMLIGGGVNYLAFWLSTKSSSFIYNNVIIGVAIGSLAGMVFNYVFARFFIYNKI